MFRCPACNEVLAAGSTTCRYCGLALSPDQASLAAAQFATVSQAVTQANNLKFGNIAALGFIVIDAFLCLTADLFTTRFLYGQLIPLGATAVMVGWFFKYGRLETRDPDYPEAKTAMKKSLIVWIATLVVQIGLLGFLFWRLQQGK